MRTNFDLSPLNTALLVIDMQDKVFASVDRSHEVLQIILQVIRGFQILNLPIYYSEQYPKGLGNTVLPIKTLLGNDTQPWIKNTFSCVDDAAFYQIVVNSQVQQWVLVGIEAHICVLQTAKGLLKLNKNVVVLNDAITSRSIYNFSTAIAELRDAGARISCMETVLFELVHDSENPNFKQISQLVKSSC